MAYDLLDIIEEIIIRRCKKRGEGGRRRRRLKAISPIENFSFFVVVSSATKKSKRHSILYLHIVYWRL